MDRNCVGFILLLLLSVVSVTSGCLNCNVKGRLYRGHSRFQYDEGCKRYQCVCRCNGTWECPPGHIISLCEHTPAPPSSGQETPASSSHDLLPKVLSITLPRYVDGSRCAACNVWGRQHQGNSYFAYTEGCVAYRNCFCYCNGSWACPTEAATNVCSERQLGVSSEAGSFMAKDAYLGNMQEFRTLPSNRNGGDSSIAESSRHIGNFPNECLNCSAGGKIIRGNNYFELEDGCRKMSYCSCFCNGTWTCPERFIENICQTDIPDISEMRCSDCLAYSKYFKGGSNFEVTDGCVRYRKCVCRCDGSWNCNNRFAVNLCASRNNRNRTHDRVIAENKLDITDASTTGSNMSAGDSQCSFCDARNQVVVGNSLFELTEGCVEYKNCLCRCDGSWECPPQFAKNICPETSQRELTGPQAALYCSNCIAKEKIIRGGTNFELQDGCLLYTSCQCDCTGKWTCSQQHVKNICSADTSLVTGTCSACQPGKGVEHPPNSWFKLADNCVEHTCQCFCNGTWSCPADYNRWICTGKCLQCEVDGRKVANNTQFTLTRGCREYTCDCHCNGSWSCPEDSTRDVCAAVVGSQDQCGQCVVSESQIYRGETNFVLPQGCLHYKCRCNCDGSYFCPGKEARNVCRGEVIGGCKSCVVSETQIHQGDSHFVLRKGCIFYQCKCNCDGSWYCPAESSSNVCLGEFPGRCRACRVSPSEIYRPSSVFDFRRGCISYRCKCNCDGSWSCPGQDARDICKGEVPGGCKSCVISSNEYYRGHSDFETTRDCVRYKCHCNCDGTYNCPGQTAKRVCQTGSQAVTPFCRSCRVSATEEFPGNSAFTLNRDCSRFECLCACDGSWECPSDRIVHTCAGDGRELVSSSRCKVCRIADKVFPGNSEFRFNSGCYQFSCSCGCSGMWSCDTENLTNVCREREQAIPERSLVSDASSVTKITSIVVPASVKAFSGENISGNTFAEPDIHTQEAVNYLDSSASGDNSASHDSRVLHYSRALHDRRYSRGSSDAFTTTPNPDRSSTDPPRTVTDPPKSLTHPSSISGAICRDCFVDGRHIRLGQQFALVRGCVEYKKCKCYCSGRWRCAELLDRCQSGQLSSVSNDTVFRNDETTSFTSTKSAGTQTHHTDVEGTDTTTNVRKHDREDMYVSDQAVASQQETKLMKTVSEFAEKRYNSGSKKFKFPDICSSCDIRGASYAGRSKFVLRDGCNQRICDCFCDGSWTCVDSNVDICKLTTQDDEGDQCKNCLVGSDVYIPGRDFQINEECYQHNCFCFCNGSYVCPVDRQRKTCQPNIKPEPDRIAANLTKYLDPPAQQVLSRKENDDDIIPSQIPGCKNCQMDGKTIQTLTTFTRHVGCYQMTCLCQCNGVPSCPPSSFVDICSRSNRKSPAGRTGCQVGDRTYFTRVFPHVENCIRRACVCHDDGKWSCRRAANDRRVC